MSLENEQQNIPQETANEQSAAPVLLEEVLPEAAAANAPEDAPAVDQASPDDFLESNAKAKKRAKIWDIALTVVLVVLIAVLVTSLVVKWFVRCKVGVSGDSMMPNFQNGQTVWVDKRQEVKRGDVIVFYKQHVSNKFLAELSFGDDTKAGGKYEKLIKRVVALGGDRIWIEPKNGGYVLVILTAEGDRLYEDYYTVNGKQAQFYDELGELGNTAYLGLLYNLKNTSEANPLVIKPGYFYVMGDNRHDSNDSRQMGSFKMSQIYGVVIEK